MSPIYNIINWHNNIFPVRMGKGIATLTGLFEWILKSWSEKTLIFIPLYLKITKILSNFSLNFWINSLLSRPLIMKIELIFNSSFHFLLYTTGVSPMFIPICQIGCKAWKQTEEIWISTSAIKKETQQNILLKCFKLCVLLIKGRCHPKL